MRSKLVCLALFLAPPSTGRAQDASVPDADVPDAACNDVDTLGHCQGDILRACVDGLLTELDCRIRFGPGFTCELSPGLGAAQCIHPERDAGTELDGGTSDDGDAGETINPPNGSSGGCVKLTPGEAGFVSSVGIVLMGRRRKRAQNT